MTKRRKKIKKINRFPYILIILGLLLGALWITHRALYYQSLRLTEAILASYAGQQAPEAIPVFLTTRGIKKLAIVQSDGTIIAPHAANHVRQSGVPGSIGNIILYGHNTKNIFGPIRWLSIGDSITLTTANGTEYRYRVFHKEEVSPSKTEFLFPTNTEILTLYTCSGLFDSQRFILRAIPI